MSETFFEKTWKMHEVELKRLGDQCYAEACAVVSAIFSSGIKNKKHQDMWCACTGQSAGSMEHFSKIGRKWQTHATPQVTYLVSEKEQLANTYISMLVSLASAAATEDPVDLERINVAAFIANAQTNALPTKKVTVKHTNEVELNTEISKSVNDVTVSKLDEEVNDTLEELYAQLDGLTGLKDVKDEVRKQVEMLRIAKLRKGQGLDNHTTSKHLIFTGNPGTGKTTVARLIAKMYKALGVLEKGHLVEVDKSGLVGGYLGQTEEKTSKVVQSALGGVLFIDEAYALAGDDYGQAAIDTLVKAVEDYRDNLVLIVAGYTQPMAEFVDSNPGLASRLPKTIYFADYSDEELLTIFKSMAKKADYIPTSGCLTAFKTILTNTPRDESFGNGRFVRNCFEAAIVRQAWRLRKIPDPSVDQLVSLTVKDMSVD